MEIEKDDKNLIIKIPLWQDSYDALDNKVGEIPNIIGVIEGDEQGFHKLIDMTYKDKEPQIDGLLVATNYSREDFEKLCDDLGIEFFEYPICDTCGKVIYGSFTYNEKGKLCYECENLVNIVFKFCPVCGRASRPLEYGGFDVADEQVCVGCNRPWIACGCSTGNEGG